MIGKLLPNPFPGELPWSCEDDSWVFRPVATWWVSRAGAGMSGGPFDHHDFIAYVNCDTAPEAAYKDGTSEDYCTHFYAFSRAAWKAAWRLARMMKRNGGRLSLYGEDLPEDLYIEDGLHHEITVDRPVLALADRREEVAA